jgi:hypothetical protein
MVLSQSWTISVGQNVRRRGAEIYDTVRLGLYDGMPDRERVAILLNLLGRKVRVLLNAVAAA